MAQPEIARATVDLDGSMAGAELKKLEARARELRQELTKLGKDNDLGGFRQKEKELKLVNNQMRSLKKSTWDVEQVLNRLNGASLNELTRASRQLNAELKTMTRNTKEEIKAYNQKIGKLKQVNAELDKVKNEIRAVDAAQQGWFSRAATGFNKYFTIITAGIAAFTGVVFSIKSLIQGNVELDDSLADVMKTTGLTKKEVRELYNEFKNFNTRTPRRELLALAEEAGRLGKKSKKDILDFVEVANQIKVALGDDLGGNAEVAIREVGKLTAIFKVGEKYGVDFRQSMLMVGSSINEVSANSLAQAGYLIELSKRMAGVSSQAGISVQDIIGYAAALDGMGQSGEVSATTLNKVIVNMFKDVETYSHLAGVSIDEFNQLLRKDANEALLKVLEGLNGNNAGLSAMAQKLDGLGLDGSRSVQVLAALASNIELVRQQQDMASRSLEEATSLTTEYNVKNNNLAGNMKKVGRALRAVFINSQINQTLTGLIDKVAKWIEIPVSKTLEDQRIKINMLTVELTNSNTQEQRRKDIWEELKSLAPEILEGIKQESINIDLLRENLARYNEEAIRKIALQRASEELNKIQEKLGSKVGERARTEADLTKSLIRLRDQAANYDKDRSETINEILTSNIDLLDKEKQINDVISEINRSQRGNVIIGTRANNLAYELNNLRQEENILLEKSNQELSKYQEMYKSIMGGGPGKGAGTAPGAAPVPVDPDPPSPLGSGGAASFIEKLLDQQAAFRMRLIMEARSLIEQEEYAYQERLKQAGIFGKKKEELTAEQLEAAVLLELDHNEKLKKINDQAFNDDILQQKNLFDTVTLNRQIAHNNDLAALGNDEKAKAEAKKRFEKQELERQQAFFVSLLAELQATMDGSELSGIDEKLLTDEQKERIRQRIDEVKLMLSELGLKLSELQSGGAEEDTDLGAKKAANVDIFGMTSEDWILMIEHIMDGKFAIEDLQASVGTLINAWSDFYDIKNNLDQQELQQYQSGIDRKKQLLEDQLNRGKISQENYNKQIQQLDEGLDTKRKAIAVRAAKREKQIALMNAIVNTAAGIVKMLNNPFPLNLILAALVGVAGGLQIAKIATTPLPQYASGKYDVIGQQDGKRYRASVINSPRTGIVNEPAIIVGEKPEIIIDPQTTRNLQVNYPEVLQAIAAARLPQYAAGKYPATTSKETITERELPREFYELMAMQAEQIRRLTDRLDKVIGAKLVANGQYIETHNEVMEDYNILRSRVDLKD